MYARCSALRLVAKPLKLQYSSIKLSTRYPTRRFASNSQSPPTPTNVSSSSTFAVFGSLAQDLDQIAPRFELDAEQIQILREPKEFYELLKTKISSAQKRIYLSTLYIGRTEDELIATIREALRSQPGLKVSFLTDALRGTREEPERSCASLLAPLVAEFGAERVDVRMFHTPNLVGLRKKILPKRINEGWGLQHMKLYGVDDEIILSGANLSNDYFTNRQDRYHVFKSKALTDYYYRIHAAVSSISFRVVPSDSPSGFTMTWPISNPGPSPLDDAKGYISIAQTLLEPMIIPSAVATTSLGSASKTLVYPLFQLTPLLPSSTPERGRSTELPALLLLLRHLASPAFAPARWTFTAGYFNMTPSVRTLLLSSLDTQTAHGAIITAHPQANGFFGSKGVSGMLPPAYTLLARRFLDAVKIAGLNGKVTLKEWRRGNFDQQDRWTYHAKGLWITMPQKDIPSTHGNDFGNENLSEQGGPSIALIGSSNYTARSHTLDLEANALIVTRDEGLRRRLAEEEAWLQEYACPVGPDEFAKTERRVSWTVRLALWFVGVVGGAL